MNEIACSTYAYLGTPLSGALQRMGDAGFSCAELVLHDSPEWGHLRPAEMMENPEGAASTVREAQEASGVRIIAATLTMAENILWQRGEFEAACRFLRAARIHIVTLPAGRKDEKMEAFRLRDFREVAARLGVTLSVEAQSMMNWGDSLFLLPWEASGFARGEPGHRITLDTGHMLHAGVRQEDWKSLFEFTDHIHIRDAKQGKGLSQVPFGEGDLRVDTLLRDLREAHYSGMFTVEYLKSWEEGMPLDPERESGRALAALEEGLGKLEA